MAETLTGNLYFKVGVELCLFIPVFEQWWKFETKFNFLGKFLPDFVKTTALKIKYLSIYQTLCHWYIHGQIETWQNP